jgi:hypothetical protein
MSRTTGKLLVAAAGAWFALGVWAVAQDLSGEALRTFFTVRSAVVDDSLPAELAEEFEKDDGAPLKSVPLDLDGDGRDEKFVLSGSLSPSGGTQWLVFDPRQGVSRGVVIGTIIFIGRETQDGLPVLETYWKQGREMGVVFRYACSRGRYGRTHSRSLTVQEISDYFRSKPPLDQDLELVEIRGAD